MPLPSSDQFAWNAKPGNEVDWFIHNGTNPNIQVVVTYYKWKEETGKSLFPVLIINQMTRRSIY